MQKPIFSPSAVGNSARTMLLRLVEELFGRISDLFVRSRCVPKSPVAASHDCEPTTKQSLDPLLFNMDNTPVLSDSDLTALLRDLLTEVRNLAERFLIRLDQIELASLPKPVGNKDSTSTATPTGIDEMPTWEPLPVVPIPPEPVSEPTKFAEPSGRPALVSMLEAIVPNGQLWATAISALGPFRKDGQFAEAVATVLGNPPGAWTAEITAVFTKWVAETKPATIQLVSALEAAVENRGSVPASIGSTFVELPGIRVKSRLIRQPVLQFPDTPAGRVALLGWQDSGSGMSADDLLSLGSGARPVSVDGLRRIMGWSDRPDTQIATDVRSLVSSLAGVETVAVPDSVTDTRFDVVRRLYRSGSETHLWTLLPAVVSTPTRELLKQGRVEFGAGRDQPMAETFMEQEVAALMDEIQSRPTWVFEFAGGMVLERLRPDEAREKLGNRIKDFAAAASKPDPVSQATSFAQFFQDVCRVVVLRGEAEAITNWRSRQEKFRQAIKAYLRSFSLKEEPATISDHYGKYAGSYNCIRFAPTRSDSGQKNGQILQMIAPKLVYEPLSLPLKGTLLYLST